MSILSRAGLIAAALMLLPVSHSTAREYTTGHLSIGQPWARATPPGARNGAGYLMLRNDGREDDRLLRAEADVSVAVELHAHRMEDGMMAMRPLSDLPIPAGATVELKPGGMHLMLVELKRPLRVGERFPVTLHFAHAPSITVEFHVEEGTVRDHGQAHGSHAPGHGQDAPKQPHPHTR
jgi:hypothetical protein